MTRDVARRLVFLLLRASSASAVVVLASSLIPACSPDGGGGTDPPTNTFYFPQGLAVSSGGNALYVVNSDFDLQWNGGTLQSYDLFAIRRDTTRLIQANLSGGNVNALGLDLVEPWIPGQCLTGQPAADGGGAFPTVLTNAHGRIALGEGCAPPVNSTKYVRDSKIIGAFASDLQLETSTDAEGNVTVLPRLYAPVRGDATLTWADTGPDDPCDIPGPDVDGGLPSSRAGGASSCTPGMLTTDPYTLGCSGGDNVRCDDFHKAGNNANAPGDTRNVTIPGEPFGMAQSPDGTAIVLTHQTENQSSLLEARDRDAVPAFSPSMQFVLDNVVTGGSGIVAIPHDPHSSVPPCELGKAPPCVNPAFLETSNAATELDLLRYYSDDNSGLRRPFLTREAVFPFSTNIGAPSLGIVIDPTPREACRALPGSDATVCGDLPARLFFANRDPASLVIGTVGGPSASGDGTYDPDLVTFTGNVPLPQGPSRVYLGPVVNLEGNLEIRVFVVNFDSSTLSIYDPNQNLGQPDLALVDTINLGAGVGPSAMAFDPFDMKVVARNGPDPIDPRQGALNLRRYRYAYVANFTYSFVQVIDLDESQPTFESVVFTLGNPTKPKGQ